MSSPSSDSEDEALCSLLPLLSSTPPPAISPLSSPGIDSPVSLSREEEHDVTHTETSLDDSSFADKHPKHTRDIPSPLRGTKTDPLDLSDLRSSIQQLQETLEAIDFMPSHPPSFPCPDEYHEWLEHRLRIYEEWKPTVKRDPFNERPVYSFSYSTIVDAHASPDEHSAASAPKLPDSNHSFTKGTTRKNRAMPSCWKCGKGGHSISVCLEETGARSRYPLRPVGGQIEVREKSPSPPRRTPIQKSLSTFGSGTKNFDGPRRLPFRQAVRRRSATPHSSREPLPLCPPPIRFRPLSPIPLTLNLEHTTENEACEAAEDNRTPTPSRGSPPPSQPQ